MELTDKNIPMECPECTFRSEGIEDMEHHVHVMHSYSWDEAKRHVGEWAENAYVEAEESLANYYDDRKLDKAIHADTFPHK